MLPLLRFHDYKLIVWKVDKDQTFKYYVFPPQIELDPETGCILSIIPPIQGNPVAGKLAP